MRIKLLSSVCLLFVLTIISCKDEDKNLKGETPIESIEDIQSHYKAKDSTIVEAYVNDKSTVSVKDIDLKDTTYSARTKVLYKAVTGSESLAVVYGYKIDNSPGIAIVQRGNAKPVRLPEIEHTGVKQAVYSNGSIKLTRNGNSVFYAEDSGSDQFVEIE
ncbi:hypothetical protein [Niabella aurantiaca]|uniref:hypothetical protein n=1 Tax=Niabella aurantiaca TaxID=379900 RepID=UPI0003A14E79|nr:hypothetical protein [Niabella aurantiaca]